jgi:hypothetical protein
MRAIVLSLRPAFWQDVRQGRAEQSCRGGGGDPTMLIAILNQSTLVSNADAATITEAIAAQVRLDAAPLWDRDARWLAEIRRVQVPWATEVLALPYLYLATVRS